MEPRMTTRSASQIPWVSCTAMDTQTIIIFHHHCQSFTGVHHHRSISPNRSISISPRGSARSNQIVKQTTQKRTFMCSPTNHPGFFRCSLPKGVGSRSSSSFSAS
ncbi:hypothetical protein FCV25MIE_34229, partial [Fagus crenata]